MTTTVREATWALMRAHGMTTVFGNPGSTELGFFLGWPADFRLAVWTFSPERCAPKTGNHSELREASEPAFSETTKTRGEGKPSGVASSKASVNLELRFSILCRLRRNRSPRCQSSFSVQGFSSGLISTHTSDFVFQIASKLEAENSSIVMAQSSELTCDRVKNPVHK